LLYLNIHDGAKGGRLFGNRDLLLEAGGKDGNGYVMRRTSRGHNPYVVRGNTTGCEGTRLELQRSLMREEGEGDPKDYNIVCHIIRIFFRDRRGS